jgi:hypothetical protein|tara:strand:- start:1426 stop:1614 length:189 start_codon:yes stop_codon:yes gene_type:complete
MGKVKAWMTGMEEDAEVLTAQEFIEKHGSRHLEVWSMVQWRLKREDNIDEQYLAFCKTEGDA